MIKKSYMLVYIGILGLLLACKEDKNKNRLKIQKEEAAIISVFIDKLSIPYPLPPPPKKGHVQKTPNWDSIMKVKTTIIVDTVMFKINRKITLPKKFYDYQVLVDSINNLPKKNIPEQFIKSKEGHTLIFGNSLEDFKGKYPQKLSVSRIVLNEKGDMAALYIGYYTSRLSGYINLYLIKKIEGKWKVIFKDNISIT